MALRSDTITADQLLGHCRRVRDRKLSRSSWIDDWDPEDLKRWALGGERLARRNLIFSVLWEHIGFSVWSLWSPTPTATTPCSATSGADSTARC